MRIYIAVQTPWPQLSTLGRISIVYFPWSRIISLFPFYPPGPWPISQILYILDTKQHPEGLSKFELWYVVLDILWPPFELLMIGWFFRVHAAYRMQFEVNVLKEGWQPRTKSTWLVRLKRFVKRSVFREKGDEFEDYGATL
jgi:hypothetical protein